LVIATATADHPGFSGSITRELLSLGEVPLVIYPGTRVAQIVFFDCEGATPYQGDMAHRTGAHFPGLAHAAKAADAKCWATPRTPV
jgi:dCTP deaminase